jgi:hypothetical protein
MEQRSLPWKEQRPAELHTTVYSFSWLRTHDVAIVF